MMKVLIMFSADRGEEEEEAVVGGQDWLLAAAQHRHQDRH